MSIFMLLIFEVETGVASACVLSSGILVLLVVVIHTLVKACRGAEHYGGDHLDTLFRNDHGDGHALVSRHRELKLDVDRPRPRLQQQMSYPPPCGDPRPQQYQRQYSPPGGSRGHAGDKDGYSSGGSGSRLHRSLSTESGLLQAQTKPWNGVNNEMRSVLARKSGISAKDSTLV